MRMSVAFFIVLVVVVVVIMVVFMIMRRGDWRQLVVRVMALHGAMLTGDSKNIGGALRGGHEQRAECAYESTATNPRRSALSHVRLRCEPVRQANSRLRA